MDRVLSRRTVLGLATAAGLTAAGLGSACSRSGESASSATSSVSDKAALEIATDAYIFGYPLVLVHATKNSAGVLNTLRHARTLPDDEDRLITRANVDTLYSSAWLNLSGEPLILQVPAAEPGRFWLMQVLDAWTNTVHNPSSVRPGTPGAPPVFTYLISGPKWSGTVPAGVTHLPMPTDTSWVLGRVQVNGPDDVPAVLALQDRMRMQPLSAWLTDPAAPTPSGTIDLNQLNVPSKEVAALDGRTFFNRLCTLMTVDPPAAADAPALRAFASIGIEPGGNTNELSIATLDAAAAAARKTIATHIDPSTKTEHGWLFSTALGRYGTDYDQRAAVALNGLGANLPEDALYPTTPALSVMVNGKPRSFRLRFEAGQFPPVAAFWSLTAYDADNFLIHNPAEIYAVGHGIPVVPGPDGAVEIAVQNVDPGPAVPRGNWLPIPATGTFTLTLRLYAPKPEAIDGRWKPPELKPVPP